LCARHADRVSMCGALRASAPRVGYVPDGSPQPMPRRVSAVSIQRRLAACSAEMSAKAAAAAGAWSCSITIQPS